MKDITLRDLQDLPPTLDLMTAARIFIETDEKVEPGVPWRHRGYGRSRPTAGLYQCGPISLTWSGLVSLTNG